MTQFLMIFFFFLQSTALRMNSLGAAENDEIELKPSMMIVSASFGTRDTGIILRKLPPGVPGVLYTDLNISSTNGWTAVQRPYHSELEGTSWAANSQWGRYSWGGVNKSSAVHNVMAAKFYKMNAYLLPELKGYDQIFWLDAHMLHQRKTLNPLLKDQVGKLLENHMMVMPSHPERSTVSSEVVPAAKQAVQTTKDRTVYHDTAEAFKHQVKEGFKDDAGLWWCGVFAYDAKEMQVQQALQAWWKEVQMYTFRDQISFPYIVQKYSVLVRSISPAEMVRHVENDPTTFFTEFAPEGIFNMDEARSKQVKDLIRPNH